MCVSVCDLDACLDHCVGFRPPTRKDQLKLWNLCNRLDDRKWTGMGYTRLGKGLRHRFDPRISLSRFPSVGWADWSDLVWSSIGGWQTHALLYACDPRPACLAASRNGSRRVDAGCVCMICREQAWPRAVERDCGMTRVESGQQRFKGKQHGSGSLNSTSTARRSYFFTLTLQGPRLYYHGTSASDTQLSMRVHQPLETSSSRLRSPVSEVAHREHDNIIPSFHLPCHSRPRNQPKAPHWPVLSKFPPNTEGRFHRTISRQKKHASENRIRMKARTYITSD